LPWRDYHMRLAPSEACKLRLSSFYLSLLQ